MEKLRQPKISHKLPSHIEFMHTKLYNGHQKHIMRTLPLLLEPEQLASQLQHISATDNVIILEQASKEEYEQGHIPGSHWLDFKRLQSSTSFAGMLPQAAQLSTLFNELGITESTHIICSDGEGGGWAGRLIWVLDCLGHKHYSFLNGGLTAWRLAKLPCEQSVPIASKNQTDYLISINAAPFTVSKEQILTSLEQSTLTLWDARSEDEYNGKKAVAARGGHIPQAIHYEWTRALDKTNGLRIRNLDELRQEIQAAGFNQQQTIAAYCQSHHRSGFIYFLGKLLDLNIKGYAGSWSEWGNASDTPISVHH